MKSGGENIIHAARTPEEMRAKTANSCAVIVMEERRQVCSRMQVTGDAIGEIWIHDRS